MMKRAIFTLLEKGFRKACRESKRAYYREVECFANRFWDCVAQVICNAQRIIFGTEYTYQMITEIAIVEREKAIANGTYNDFECIDF